MFFARALALTLPAAVLLLACSNDPANTPNPNEPSGQDEVASNDDSASETALDGGTPMDARRPASDATQAALGDAAQALKDAAPSSSGDTGTVWTPPVRVKPSIEGPVVTGPLPGKAITTSTLGDVDLAQYGYVETEYLIEGTASSYKAVAPMISRTAKASTASGPQSATSRRST